MVLDKVKWITNYDIITLQGSLRLASTVYTSVTNTVVFSVFFPERGTIVRSFMHEDFKP